MIPRRTKRVREPVQVYLDPRDRDLLEEVAAHTGLSRAEVMRRGLRRVAGALLEQGARGSSLEVLTGALAECEGLPADLAARHDHYLYGTGEPSG